MEAPITKCNKNTNEETLVGVNEFLDFVGSGKKTREEALTALIEGGLYQNIEIAFYIKEIRGDI